MTDHDKNRAAVKAIIHRFGTAADCAAGLGLKHNVVRNWYNRAPAQIPQRYWSDLMALAKEKNVHLTLDELLLSPVETAA